MCAQEAWPKVVLRLRIIEYADEENKYNEMKEELD